MQDGQPTESKYRGRDSNPHGASAPEDFKSPKDNDLPRLTLSAVSRNGITKPTDAHTKAHIQSEPSAEVVDAWRVLVKRGWHYEDTPPLPRLSRYLAPEYVYAVRSEGRVKIGYSSHPPKRLQSLQTASPYPLETLAVWPSFVLSEEEAHARFDDCRSHGEWFDGTAELLAWIGTMRKKGRIGFKIQRTAAAAVQRMRDGTRRPLQHLAEVEKRLRDDRVTREWARWEEQMQALGCQLCGAPPEEATRRSKHIPGFLCTACTNWSRQVAKEGIGDMRLRYVERVAEAKERLRQHDQRSISLGCLVREALS